MEALHTVLQTTQLSSLDLASRVRIGTYRLVSAGVAGRGGRPVKCHLLYGIGEDREKVLLFRTSPDIVLRMVCKSRSPHAQRAMVRMASGKFQNQGDECKEDCVPEHEKEFNGYAGHYLLPPDCVMTSTKRISVDSSNRLPRFAYRLPSGVR